MSWWGTSRAEQDSIFLAAIESNARILAKFTDAIRAQTEAHERMVRSILILKGLHPHNADPKTFAPGGMTWEAVEKMRAQMAEEKPAAPERSLEELMEEQEAQQDREVGEEIIKAERAAVAAYNEAKRARATADKSTAGEIDAAAAVEGI